MAEKIGIHCLVSGRVQGVWYRASTREQAKKLGITGWVRNLPDGKVEVLAFGQREQLDKLLMWLKRGPELAKVTDVQIKEIPWEVHEGFSTR